MQQRRPPEGTRCRALTEDDDDGGMKTTTIEHCIVISGDENDYDDGHDQLVYLV